MGWTRSITPSPRQKFTFSDSQRIAVIAGVPNNAAKRRSLFRSLRDFIDKVWIDYEFATLVHSQLALCKRSQHKLSVAEKAFERAAATYIKAHSAFSIAFAQLVLAHSQFIIKKGRILGDDVRDGLCDRTLKLQQTAESLYEIQYGEAFMIFKKIAKWHENEPRKAMASSASKGGGRPAGSYTNPVLRRLVCQLDADVAQLGGHLSFHKDEEAKGSMSEALRILTPFFPLNTLPKKLPLGTIARFIQVNRPPNN
jgi:hypothetical protein